MQPVQKETVNSVRIFSAHHKKKNLLLCSLNLFKIDESLIYYIPYRYGVCCQQFILYEPEIIFIVTFAMQFYVIQIMFLIFLEVFITPNLLKFWIL